MFSSYGYPGYGYSQPSYSYSPYTSQGAALAEQRRRQAILQQQRQRELQEQQRQLAHQQARENAQRRAAAQRGYPGHQYEPHPYAARRHPYFVPELDPYEAEYDDDDEQRYDYGLGHAPSGWPFGRQRRTSPSPARGSNSSKIPVRSPSPQPPTSSKIEEVREQEPKLPTPPTTPSRDAPAPQPSPARIYTEEEEAAALTLQTRFRVRQSYKRISSLYAQYQSVVSQGVSVPETIDFIDPTNAPDGVISVNSQTFTPVSPLPASTANSIIASSSKPKLAYTKNNKPIHFLIESLSRLLTQLDGVESWGDAGVRKRRKAVVNEIESLIEEVEGVDDEEAAGDVTRMEKGWRGLWRKMLKQLSEPAPPQASDSETTLSTQTASEIVPSAADDDDDAGEEYVLAPSEHEDKPTGSDSSETIPETMEVDKEKKKVDDDDFVML